MWKAGLNPEQLAVATHGSRPLVVVAGAGTGKTRALTARVGALIEAGVRAERILLLTFTRRAADDMVARALALSGAPGGRGGNGSSAAPGARPWGGTFHAVAYRLIAANRHVLGLDEISVLDPADAATVMELLRAEHGLTGTEQRMPRPPVLVDIYSRTVNTARPLAEVLETDFPWCAAHADRIAALMPAYVARKRARGQFDFDDLLLAWRALLADAVVGEQIRGLWDYVLVDEYQDVNQLQVDITQLLCPAGRGLTVVGDDAQAIYGFRGADAGHLRAVADRYPDAHTIVLHRNYRGCPPVLAVANAARPDRDGVPVRLTAQRDGGERPQVLHCYDAAEEARAVADAVLAALDDGVMLREQAVLMRTGHHSDLLELELTARRLPFRKYGGLKFLSAAHVRDFLAALRLVVNAQDDAAWYRLLRLHRGIGATRARALLPSLLAGCAAAEVAAEAPATARVALTATLDGLERARQAPTAVEQAQACLRLYEPLATTAYEDHGVRLADLARLVEAAGQAHDLAAFAVELALDPPASTGEVAGPPELDEDWLTLSTVHSAKGLEWTRVHVIGLVDGAFPSDLSFRSERAVAEEQRLFYVAVSRARDRLALYVPQRMPHHRSAADDRHSYAPPSRFLDAIGPHCDTVHRQPARPGAVALPAGRVDLPSLDHLWALS